MGSKIPQASLDRMKKTIELKKQIQSYGMNGETFCLVPFTTIILEPNGNVGVCRHKGTKFPIGNIKTHSLAEIWNNHFIRTWRREFLSGSPEICGKEVRHRHCQHCPNNNELLPFVDFSEVQSSPILKLTANFHGKCNLRCIMCDVWKLPNGLYDEINFWEPAKKDIFPHLKEVDMLSGEPFIQADTYRLIDEITEVNPACKWTFTTNMHWKLNDKIKNSLNKIFVKNFIMSVDSLKEDVYHKIRNPGQLPFVLKNIDNILQYNQERVAARKSAIHLVMNFLVQKDNWSEIKSFISFCNSKGIRPLITFLYLPEGLSLLTLSEEEKIAILETYIEQLSPMEFSQSMTVIMPLLDSLSRLNRVSMLTQMQKHSQFFSEIDKHL